MIWKPEDSTPSDITASAAPSTLPRPPVGWVPTSTARNKLEAQALVPVSINCNPNAMHVSSNPLLRHAISPTPSAAIW